MRALVIKETPEQRLARLNAWFEVKVEYRARHKVVVAGEVIAIPMSALMAEQMASRLSREGIYADVVRP